MKITESEETSNIDTAAEDSNLEKDQELESNQEQENEADESGDIELADIHMGELEQVVDSDSTAKIQNAEILDDDSKHSNEEPAISEDNSRLSAPDESNNQVSGEGELEKMEQDNESELQPKSLEKEKSSKKKKLDVDSDESSQSSIKKMKIDHADQTIDITESLEKDVEKEESIEEKEKPADSPKAQETVEKENDHSKPVPLTFLRKFKKPHDKINRYDLEEILMQKVLERILYKSDLSELKGKLESHEKTIVHLQKKTGDLAKQYADMEMIHNRVIKDLEMRNEGIVTPVKITRAVGLQVYQPVRQKSAQMDKATSNQQITTHPPTQIQNLHKPPIPEANKTVPTSLTQNNLNAMARKPTVPATTSPVATEPPKLDARKRGPKITPMRPPLSEKQKADLTMLQHKEQQQLLQNFKTQINIPAKQVLHQTVPTSTQPTILNQHLQPQKIHNFTGQIVMQSNQNFQQLQQQQQSQQSPNNPNKTIYM